MAALVFACVFLIFDELRSFKRKRKEKKAQEKEHFEEMRAENERRVRRISGLDNNDHLPPSYEDVIRADPPVPKGVSNTSVIEHAQPAPVQI
ncbi:hypothetical protein L228DRAFT_244936 [Xylona heveae TC161]|uniref:Uncharacterized protein n=1 Tax=Xylona heveae (strain CBS 132557 / TC161) TaxID=1328760 RepID=A0A165HXJ9_XYLHT|nr:hypothetical protein L228DRAFT_244936 [Xylona heveae TC161]KZF24065.1 hypothetical protein L228DRAFT_244936 [Xylona heveae TC161]